MTRAPRAQSTTTTARTAAKPVRAGSVAFVGSGPGDPGLLTVRAVDLIREAEIVITEGPEHPALVRTLLGLPEGSEAGPELVDGGFVGSSETDLRLKVYSSMHWGSFDKIFYYDASKAAAAEKLGWPIAGFRPMPIDLSVFRPASLDDRPIDVFFIGKATEHRIAQMDFLRTMKVNYRWVAHGLTGRELAETFRRSKVVLNIHADGLPSLEPRIYLAAACGCVVLSEKTEGDLSPFEDRVMEYNGPLHHALIRSALERAKSVPSLSSLQLGSLSARRFIMECARGREAAHAG